MLEFQDAGAVCQPLAVWFCTKPSVLLFFCPIHKMRSSQYLGLLLLFILLNPVVLIKDIALCKYIYETYLPISIGCR